MVKFICIFSFYCLYIDWSCGGEWNHMVEFLCVFFTTLQQANVHTAIFVNGALEPDRYKLYIYNIYTSPSEIVKVKISIEKNERQNKILKN